MSEREQLAKEVWGIYSHCGMATPSWQGVGNPTQDGIRKVADFILAREAGLRKERDAAIKEIGKYSREAGRLHSALVKYGKHLGTCPAQIKWNNSMKCPCGFSAALQGGSDHAKE